MESNPSGSEEDTTLVNHAELWQRLEKTVQRCCGKLATHLKFDLLDLRASSLTQELVESVKDVEQNILDRLRETMQGELVWSIDSI